MYHEFIDGVWNYVIEGDLVLCHPVLKSLQPSQFSHDMGTCKHAISKGLVLMPLT